MMLGFTILIGYSFLGYLLHEFLHIPIPSNVIGLILLTLSLFFNIVKLEWIEEAAQFLLRNMMLFFVPVLVGTMEYFPVIRDHWFSISVSLTVSTLVVLLVTGCGVQWLTKREEKAQNEYS